jgi:hypothetical protein
VLEFGSCANLSMLPSSLKQSMELAEALAKRVSGCNYGANNISKTKLRQELRQRGGNPMLSEFSIDFVRPYGRQRATKGGVLEVGGNSLQQQSA